MDFDLMLTKVGEFGRYQKFLFFFQAPFYVFLAFVLFGQLFIIQYPNFYWCKSQEKRDCHDLTDEHWAILTGRADNPCRRYIINHKFLGCLSASCPSDAPNCISVQGNPATDGMHVREDNNINSRRRRSPQWGQPTSPSSNTLGSQYGGYWKNRRQHAQVRVLSGSGNRYAQTHHPGGTTPQPTSGTTEWSSSNSGQAPGPLNNAKQPMTAAPEIPTTTAVDTTLISTRPHMSDICDTGNGVKQDDCKNSSAIISCSISPFIIRAHPANVSLNASSPFLMNWPSDCTCDEGWTHNTTTFDYRTIVIEAGYWCDTLPQLSIDDKLTLSQSLFYVGAIIGGFGVGWVADNYGRVPALIVANLIGFAGGIFTATSSNYWVFCISRIILGMSFDNCMVMIYILVLEYVGPSYRTLVANLSIAFFYTFGTLMVPGLFELFHSYDIGWRAFQIASAIPMLFCIVAYFVVPESARWLLSKGRAEEATNILRTFAKRNGQQVSEEDFNEFQKSYEDLYADLSNEDEVSLLEALKRPRILKNFILLVLIWSILALIYDGHSRNALNLGSRTGYSFSVMFAVTASTELPADTSLYFTLDYFGRRWLAFTTLLLAAVFSMVSAIPVIAEATTLFFAFVIISRFWVNVAFNIGLQWAAELLPTVVRAQGVNFIHIMGYVFSIISPFIAALGRTDPTLTLMILGALSLAGAVLSLFLPESLGEDLPNTLEDGDAFGAKQSFWNFPPCSTVEPEELQSIQARPAEDEKVMLRNKIRGSLRSETYRSSILCQPQYSFKNRRHEDQVSKSQRPIQRQKMSRQGQSTL